KYSVIISTPPFYSPPLPSASPQKGEKIISTSRELARFNDALPFDELIESASLLLSDEGIFAVIIPRKEEENFIAMASEVNLFPNRICSVRGTDTSEEKRSMLEFSFEKIPPNIRNLTMQTSLHMYTEEYHNLVQEFYLKM